MSQWHDLGMRISCRTKFDITVTEVYGNHSRNRLPFRDASGEEVQDITQWNRSRNRQRNWETIQQVLNLRTLLEDCTRPERIASPTGPEWQFEFEIERPSSISLGEDALGAIKVDCQGVPMLLGLDERPGLDNFLIYGDNIQFSIIDK